MDEAKIVQRQRVFDIKAGVPLPQKVSHYKVDDSYLFIAPEKASFITTNKMGSLFLGYFKSGNSIQQVIEKMSAQGFAQDTITAELHEFLVKCEKKGFYEDARVLDVHVKKPHLHLDLTSRCNLTCVHCLRDAGTAQPEELTTSEWLGVIDTFSSFYKTAVCISGGEAMLHPGIFDILKRAKQRGLNVTLFTNGILINNEVVAEKLGKYVDKLQMSLDGATAEMNDRIRGKGCFDKVVRAVHLLEKTPIILDLAISVMPQNADDLEKNIEKLAQMLGPDVNLRISPSVKEGRATSEHVFTSQDTARQKIRSVVGKMFRKRLRTLAPDAKNVKLNNCGFGETMVVSSTGDIYPCNFYESRVKYGNVRDNALEKIIRKLDKDREKVDVESIGTCRNCDLKIICFGGCRLNNIYRHNNLLKPACTPKYKQAICAALIDREENFDPMALWMGQDAGRPGIADN